MSALDKSGLEEIMTPTLHLGPETDIISDILAVKKEIGLTLDGEHVKSHQVLDKDEEVPLEVQLNEDCDETAKDFLRNAADEWKTRPTASAPPNAVVTLHIDALMITNNYRDRLEDAWTGKHMREYLSRRETWDTDTLDDVDWYPLGTSLQKIFKSKKRTFARYVKFMIDMSNTSRQKHAFTSRSKTKPTVENLCPCCKAEEETTLHLFHCRHPAIRDELKRSFNILHDTLEKDEVPADVWLTIKMGIASYLNVPSPAPHPTQRASNLERAYHRQTKIGWNNFMKGRISSAWGDIMREHYKEYPSKNPSINHRQFRETLITSLWTIYDKIWKVRNAMLHDPNDIEALGNVDLNDRIRHYYDNSHDLLGPGDQHLFSENIQDQLSKSITIKRTWLRTADIRVKCTQLTHDNLLQHIMTLHDYFDPA